MSLNKPVFLICSERSGSNLIRAMMGSHPQIYAPMPLHLGNLLWRNIHLYGLLDQEQNWDLLLTHVAQLIKNQIGHFEVQITKEELHSNCQKRDFATIINYIYSQGLIKTRKQVLFLKENLVYELAPAIAHNYPDARYIIQVRDPRDVVLSMKKLSILNAGGALLASNAWKQEHVAIWKLAATLPSDQVFVHRYEDLLQQPEDILIALCKFLNIPYSNTMLHFHKTEKAQSAAKSSVAWKNLQTPLLQNNMGKYKQELRPIEIEIIEQQTADLMDVFGYSRENKTFSTLSKWLIRLSKLKTLAIWIESFWLNKNALSASSSEENQRKRFSNIAHQIKAEQTQSNKRINFKYPINETDRHSDQTR